MNKDSHKKIIIKFFDLLNKENYEDIMNMMGEEAKISFSKVLKDLLKFKTGYKVLEIMEEGNKVMCLVERTVETVEPVKSHKYDFTYKKGMKFTDLQLYIFHLKAGKILKREIKLGNLFEALVDYQIINLDEKVHRQIKNYIEFVKSNHLFPSQDSLV